MPVYKDRARETWYAKFNYSDSTGSVKQKLKRGFHTPTEATEFEHEFLTKTQPASNMRFSHLVALYMKDCKLRLKPTTYLSKEYAIDSKIMPFFAAMPLEKITPDAIKKWQSSLLLSEKNYAQTYLKFLNNQLSAIFNYAMKHYELAANPVKICGSIGKQNAGNIDYWTFESFNAFINCSDKPMYTTLYEILYWTGMRIGECLALTLSDLDFDKKAVTVSKNYARHQKQDLILESSTAKNKRTIAIPEFLCTHIKQYLATRSDIKAPERIFPIIRKTVDKHFSKTLKETHLKRIRLHDLRHSHAYLLIEQGFSPALISERLGHENIQTTLQTYGHLYDVEQASIAEKLDKLYSAVRTVEH